MSGTDNRGEGPQRRDGYSLNWTFRKVFADRLGLELRTHDLEMKEEEKERYGKGPEMIPIEDV